MALKEFLLLFKNTILGLVFMHMNKIVHRDIKPENIMKFDNCTYAIADYGEGMNLNSLEE